MKKLLVVLMMFLFWFGWSAIPASSSYPVPVSTEESVMGHNWAYQKAEIPSAWERYGKGSHAVKVAVIDTGVDAQHPFLKGNIGGGYDFVADWDVIRDAKGHGTHVAGIIRSVADVSIYSYRFYSDGAPFNFAVYNVARAIHRAVDDGCKIINISAGGNTPSMMEFLAVQYAEENGVLVVAAAGNDGKDIDYKELNYFPAEYMLPNIIAVAGTDRFDELVPTSNFGRFKVDIAAPGKDIYSTLPGDEFGMMTGTSQATALVTGVAALILSKNPKLTPTEVKQILIDSVDRNDSLKYKTIAGGRVNAWRALSRTPKPASTQ